MCYTLKILYERGGAKTVFLSSDDEEFLIGISDREMVVGSRGNKVLGKFLPRVFFPRYSVL